MPPTCKLARLVVKVCFVPGLHMVSILAVIAYFIFQIRHDPAHCRCARGGFRAGHAEAIPTPAGPSAGNKCAGRGSAVPLYWVQPHTPHTASRGANNRPCCGFRWPRAPGPSSSGQCPLPELPHTHTQPCRNCKCKFISEQLQLY